jgi:hypothetical protein
MFDPGEARLPGAGTLTPMIDRDLEMMLPSIRRAVERAVLAVPAVRPSAPKCDQAPAWGGRPDPGSYIPPRASTAGTADE